MTDRLKFPPEPSSEFWAVGAAWELTQRKFHEESKYF